MIRFVTMLSAPTGQLYYHHAATGQSTYTRPTPYPIPASAPVPASTAPTKKEKPLYKIPIASSPWTRVRTNHGNIFFTRDSETSPGTKLSVWTTPDDIADAVAEMDWDALEEEAARDKEVARLQKEMQRESSSLHLKRKVDDENVASDALSIVANELATKESAVSSPPKKRKRRTPASPVADQAIGEITISTAGVPEEENESGDEEDNNGEDDDNEDAFSSASAEEAWQREMAEGMAKLAEEETKANDDLVDPKLPTDDEEVEASDEGQNKPSFQVPAQVNLSPEEARALFKVRLAHYPILSNSNNRNDRLF